MDLVFIIGAGNAQITSNPIINLAIIYLPLALLILYGQKLQVWLITNDLSKTVGRLKEMKDRSRQETIDHITEGIDNKEETIKRLDSFLEYFTIMPVDLDPAGVINKLDHIMTSRDIRMKSEIKQLFPDLDELKANSVENVIEIATSFNFVYKIVRHFYLVGKKTNNFIILAQLQMIIPFLMLQADALSQAMTSFKKNQPVGDAIGPMIVGKLMLEHEKHDIAVDTVYAKSDISGRKAILVTAKGPAGTVGQPGNAVQELIQKENPSLLIMIDAALRLEGEKTGEVAEGVGAAIGGIGVDKFKIEEAATNNNIPVYAIIVKQTIVEAISVMTKEIAESVDSVHDIIHRIIDERTKPNDKVIIVGVGNTIGVIQ